MARNYDIGDLEYWDARIREKAEAFGLSCFPQEFEMCDHTQMLNCMAYHGMPSHYPHWRSEEHTSELQSLMRISYAVFCLKKKKITTTTNSIRLIYKKIQ